VTVMATVAAMAGVTAPVMVVTMAVMAVATPLATAAFMTVMAVSAMALVSLRRGPDVRRDLQGAHAFSFAGSEDGGRLLVSADRQSNLYP